MRDIKKAEAIAGMHMPSGENMWASPDVGPSADDIYSEDCGCEEECDCNIIHKEALGLSSIPGELVSDYSFEQSPHVREDVDSELGLLDKSSPVDLPPINNSDDIDMETGSDMENLLDELSSLLSSRGYKKASTIVHGLRKNAKQYILIAWLGRRYSFEWKDVEPFLEPVFEIERALKSFHVNANDMVQLLSGTVKPDGLLKHLESRGVLFNGRKPTDTSYGPNRRYGPKLEEYAKKYVQRKDAIEDYLKKIQRPTVISTITSEPAREPSFQPEKAVAPTNNTISMLEKSLGLNPTGKWNATLGGAWNRFVVGRYNGEHKELVMTNWREAAPLIGYSPTVSGMVKFVEDTNRVWRQQARKPISEEESAGDRKSESLPRSKEEQDAAGEIDTEGYITESIRLMVSRDLKFNTPFRPERRQVSRWLKRFFDNDVEEATAFITEEIGVEKLNSLIQDDIKVKSQGKQDFRGRQAIPRSGKLFETLYTALKAGIKNMRKDRRKTRRSERKSRQRELRRATK